VAEPELTHAVNVNGTLNSFACRARCRGKAFGYAASSSAYGESEVLPKREDMLPRPISPYAVQKLTGEYYLQTFSAVYRLETVSLRYFNIFGPRQDANSQYAGVLAKFITQMQTGRIADDLRRRTSRARDFTFVANAVQANLKACVAPAKEVSGRVFNIATGTRFP